MEKETEYLPKPMLTVGGKPIIWHIMKIYSHYGFKDFILCLGYKGEIIRDYFANYHRLNCDFTVNLKNGEITFHHDHPETDWNVTLAETGADSMTGARIKRIEKYVKTPQFLATYGDGLSNINIKKLFDFHKEHGKIGTLSGVYPPSRFGELVTDGCRVTKFIEKPVTHGIRGAINGGFFVFNTEFFRYLSEDKNCVLEREPLERLAEDGEMMAYNHNGFWHCIDTRRDLDNLNRMWTSGDTPWKVW